MHPPPAFLTQTYTTYTTAWMTTSGALHSVNGLSVVGCTACMHVPCERATVVIGIAKVVPTELGRVPGVEVATMVLVVVVESIVELPVYTQRYYDS